GSRPAVLCRSPPPRGGTPGPPPGGSGGGGPPPVVERIAELSPDPAAQAREWTAEARAAQEEMRQRQVDAVVGRRHHREVRPRGVEGAGEDELPALVVRLPAGVAAAHRGAAGT